MIKAQSVEMEYIHPHLGHNLKSLLEKNNYPARDLALVELKPEIISDFKILREELENINYLGSLIIERTTFIPSSSIPTIELDRNQYFNVIDYELESEIKNKEERTFLLDFLNDLNINIETPSESKYKRLIKILRSFQSCIYQ